MFATQFGTDYSCEYFMGELKDGHFNANEQVMNYLREDIAAGLQATPWRGLIGSLLLAFFDPPCNTPVAPACAARLSEGFYFSLYLSAPAYALML